MLGGFGEQAGVSPPPPSQLQPPSLPTPLCSRFSHSPRLRFTSPAAPTPTPTLDFSSGNSPALAPILLGGRL